MSTSSLSSDAKVTGTDSTFGSLDVTVSQIAVRAGVSSALAHHYFGSKDQILLAAMRHILREFGASARHAIARAEAPRERIKAIIAASFAPQQFDREIVAAGLAFYVQAQNSCDAERLLRVYAYRLDSNLVFALRRLVAEGVARRIAQGLAFMIDGFYIRCALQNCAPNPGDARALVEEYLDMSLEREAGRNSADPYAVVGRG
jgi:TetR/AcrR family transcriptional repressor of bet genes